MYLQWPILNRLLKLTEIHFSSRRKNFRKIKLAETSIIKGVWLEDFSYQTVGWDKDFPFRFGSCIQVDVRVRWPLPPFNKLDLILSLKLINWKFNCKFVIEQLVWHSPTHFQIWLWKWLLGTVSFRCSNSYQVETVSCLIMKKVFHVHIIAMCVREKWDD